MASETETVADIVKEVSGFECYGHISAERAKFIVSDLTRRFEAAHKREVAGLRECLSQAYGDKIGTYTMRGNEVQLWRKALEGGAK